MFPAVVRRILYPLHERLRGRKTLSYLRRFRGTEHLDPDQSHRLTDAAVAALVRHAATTCDYWKDVFLERGLALDAIQGVADLVRLPTMDKPLIRAELERLVSEPWRERVFKLETGGSSGEPLIFYTDKDREASQLAARYRTREWFGVRIGDRQTDLWGSPIELSAHDRLRDVKDRLLNCQILSAFQLSDECMSTFRRRIEAHGTDFLYGYASVLARYARFLEERGEDLRHLGMKAAFSTAELLFPDQREVIERVFGCPVVNEFGCRDGGFIAQECPEGRLHVTSDVTAVEVLDGDQPVPDGEVGELALTNLTSYGMPLIRYRAGDRGALSSEPCPCGRSLPVLDRIEGRVTDTLETPSGNRVHGLGIMYVLRVLPGLESFQVIQERVEAVEVLVVLAADADRDGLAKTIEDGTRKILGDDMKVTVTVVDEIPTTQSGKQRSVWNKM